MGKTEATPTEIIRMISAEATRLIGPWPSNLDIFVFRVDDSWECLITPTNNPTEAKFRDVALQIGLSLERIFKLRV